MQRLAGQTDSEISACSAVSNSIELSIGWKTRSGASQPRASQPQASTRKSITIEREEGTN
jgi:hypothetical protein